MKMSEMYPSKWLAKEDVPAPMQATIAQVVREEVKGDGGNEAKNVLHFHGDTKPLILNRGNATTLCEAFGDDSVNWHGKTVEVYTDPSVMFAGKRVGGLRLRIPHGAATGPQTWDLSDGTNVYKSQTEQQVKEFLSGLAVPLNTIRVKATGAPRESVQTADLWLSVRSPAPAGSDIPF